MLEQIWRDAALAVVKDLWPQYAGGDLVTIELLPKGPAAPVDGLLLWAQGRWYVLADESLGAEKLFKLLAHELAHVVNGDLRPGREGDLLVHRQAFTGKKTLPAAVAVAGLISRQHQAEAEAEEIRAWRWARAFTAKYWPRVEEVATAARYALIPELRRMQR